MELSVLERIVVAGLLPAEGSFANLKLLRVAKEELSFDEKENKFLNMRSEGTGDEARTLWNDGLEDKEIKFGEVVTQMVVKALKKLDEQEKLRAEHMSVYEKFVK